MNKIAKSIFKFNPLTHQNKYNLYLHEYQTYEILKHYGLPLVPVFRVLFRVLGQAHLRMHMPLQIESCHRLQSQNLLLI